MKKLLLILVLFIPFLSFSQTASIVKDDKLESSADSLFNYPFIEVVPEFRGGRQSWTQFIAGNMHYPLEAFRQNVSGKVILQFIIEKNGNLSNLKVLKGLGAGCDEEAIRVVRLSQPWTPGQQNGKAVRVSYIMPLIFKP